MEVREDTKYRLKEDVTLVGRSNNSTVFPSQSLVEFKYKLGETAYFTIKECMVEDFPICIHEDFVEEVPQIQPSEVAKFGDELYEVNPFHGVNSYKYCGLMYLFQSQDPVYIIYNAYLDECSMHTEAELNGNFKLKNEEAVKEQRK